MGVGTVGGKGLCPATYFPRAYIPRFLGGSRHVKNGDISRKALGREVAGAVWVRVSSIRLSECRPVSVGVNSTWRSLGEKEHEAQ